MRQDPKTIYAQSSDIRSRTYLEYRRDMKRKAIAELEVKDWLQELLQQNYPNKRVRLYKSGGDRFLWFLRGGGVTREPDFVAEIDGRQLEIEFQYAEASDLQFYDFKVSKVAFKKRGQQELVPKQNVLFLYIDKPSRSYALIVPEWIAENGRIGEVAAWRAQAYRVPKEIFRMKLHPDPQLSNILQIIDCKNLILEFQYILLDIVREQLAHRIAQAVENQQSFTIMPELLESFFDACFIMAALRQCPDHLNNWFQRAIQFGESVRSLIEAFQIAYCIDFLYFHIPVSEPLPMLTRFASTVRRLISTINSYYSPFDGAYRSSSKAEPCLETRYALFVMNSLEDIIQDMLHYRAGEMTKQRINFSPIQKIYQNLKDPIKTAEFVQRCIEKI